MKKEKEIKKKEKNTEKKSVKKKVKEQKKEEKDVKKKSAKKKVKEEKSEKQEQEIKKINEYDKIRVYLIDFTLEITELSQWDIDLYVRQD